MRGTVCMPVASHRLSAAASCLAAVLFTTACGSAAASRETATGAQLYQACESCHGPEGAGIALQGAPAIAGLPEWYVASQLERFQTGLRGKHPDDVEGLKMRPMSLQVNSAAQRQAVAAYVAGLAPAPNPASLTGVDAATGEQTFAMCVACHGMKGEGNQALNAPPLAGLDDWYVALQIRKFKTGIRGAVPGDTVGPVMAAMSMAIQPDAVDDVAAYVHALPR
jgi:cytochrome c oxidase subunit 2